MKIAITGHTKNLGLAIYNHYSCLGHSVTGYSRSNGWCIPNDIDRICSGAKNFDFFINNVYCGITQSIFLQKLYNVVPIVTIGSIAANYAVMTNNKYCRDKLHVQETHCRLKKTTANPMLLLKLGYLPNYPDKKPIQYINVLNSIHFWLQNPRLSIIEFENHPDIYKDVS